MSYKTYSYAVIDRTGFTESENALLIGRNMLWNALAGEHNRLLEKQTEFVRSHQPEALEAMLESRKLAPFNRSQITPLLAPWHQFVKQHDTSFKRMYADYVAACKEILQGAGLWWPNRERLWTEYLNAHRAQLRLVRPLHKRPVEGRVPTGWFTFRFQKPATFSGLLSENGPVRLEVLSEDKYRLHLTVNKEHMARDCGQQAACDFIVSRRPKDEEKLVSVSFYGYTDRAGQWRGKVQFLTAAEAVKPTENKLVVGLDFGWRMGEQGLLCLTASFGKEVYRRLYLPTAWVGRWQYVEDLSKNLNDSVPDGMANWEAYVGQGDKAWLKETRSRREEYHNLKEKLYRSRDDYYHQFVKELCKIAGVVVMEKMNFGKLALIQSPTIKIQQKMASPGRLHEFICFAATEAGIKIVEVPSAGTTRTCTACGHLNKGSRHTDLVCEGCGTHYDPDENAAENIRKDGLKVLSGENNH